MFKVIMLIYISSLIKIVNKMTRGFIPLFLYIISVSVQAVPISEQLDNADYLNGKKTFQQRCSACHTLAENSANIIGPNLWHIFDRGVGDDINFSYSDSMGSSDLIWDIELIYKFLRDPRKLFPDTNMVIPEPVSKELLIDMIAFMMLETDAPNKPNIERAFLAETIDKSLPISERFPSFWNHLMSNTTHYRLVTNNTEFEFDAYFNTNGSVSTNLKGVTGFWHVTDHDMFCYAIHHLPFSTSEFVECFPIAAMAIPRFAKELWRSKPIEGTILHGGILPGRPTN